MKPQWRNNLYISLQLYMTLEYFKVDSQTDWFVESCTESLNALQLSCCMVLEGTCWLTESRWTNGPMDFKRFKDNRATVEPQHCSRLIDLAVSSAHAPQLTGTFFHARNSRARADSAHPWTEIKLRHFVVQRLSRIMAYHCFSWCSIRPQQSDRGILWCHGTQHISSLVCE